MKWKYGLGTLPLGEKKVDYKTEPSNFCKNVYTERNF